MTNNFNTDERLENHMTNGKMLTLFKPHGKNLYLTSSCDHQVTGVLNNETVEVMKAPRCGVSDISRYGHFPGKPRWEKRLITYR